MALTPKPALLAKRLELARQRLSTTAKVDLAAATRPAHAPPPLPPPANPTRKNAAQKTAKPPAPEPAPAAGKPKGKGRAAEGRAAAPASAGDIAAALRKASSRPEMADLVTDTQLVDVWSAILEGAARPGPAGAADRASLSRALGLPLSQMVSTRGGAAAQVGAPIAARLETALNRSRSRAPVTDDVPADETPMETAA